MPIRPRRDSAFLRQRRKLRWKAFQSALSSCMGWLFIGLALVTLHDFLMQWDRYDIRDIRISGNRLIGREEMLEIAGLQEGVNVFRVNPYLCTKRLREDPRVQYADVAISWPDVIRIQVVERAPLARIQMDPPVFIDVEGACFQASDRYSIEGIPVVEGLQPKDFPARGVPPSSAYQETMQALKVWTAEGGLLNRNNIARILVDPDIGLTVVPKDELNHQRIGQIRIGFQHITEKTQLLERAITYMSQIRMSHPVEWIDVTDLRRIVMKPIETGPAEVVRKEK